MIGVLSAGIARIPHLQSFLGDEIRLVKPYLAARPEGLTAVAGWGQRPTTKKSRAFAARHNLPFISLEDGFLRSCGLGVHGAQPLSVIVDDLGIYYDATQPSRLEALISSLVMDSDLSAQATHALSLIRKHRLSKYNHAPEEILPPLSVGTTGRVLVLDQTKGDVSVTLGGADSAVFQAMLRAAIDENPDAEIWVKTHPDVVSGKKQGYLDVIPDDQRIHLLADDVSPIYLLEQVDKIYVVTSQMGFEALMLNKPVVCFGLPWYAGWGLTQDRHPGIVKLRKRRGVHRSLEELFAAAYLQYTRYIEPCTGQTGSIFDVIDWIKRNKEINDCMRGDIYCVGMSLWKRAVVLPFLTMPSTRVHFVRSVKALARVQLPGNAKIVIWGITNEDAVLDAASRHGVPVWRMEDGFLRSVGLGSDLNRPVSLVVDRNGIYYDPHSGSDLEKLVQAQQISAEELARAKAFREKFVAMRASKYNVGCGGMKVDANGRRVILIPGQVEDDASIKRGSRSVSSNLALLESVRLNNPDAYIIYKPHPDVVSGNRKGMVAPERLSKLADQVVIEANIIDCIHAADEVHTMTSLSGFEALLHGRIVHCYGSPFYAGWGLTIDHYPVPHRVRRATLDELLYAAFLKYPRYRLPKVQGFVSAEQVLIRLMSEAAKKPTSLSGKGLTGWIRRKVRKVKAIAQMLRDGRKYTSA